MESWLRKYLRYTADHEAPELFHFWTGMTIISAALGRKVSMDRGYYVLYPNLFTVLVAGSALCRKTTCMEIGVDILKHVETTRILSGMASAEKLMTEYDEKSEPKPATLSFEEELSVFLPKDSLGLKMINVLTKLFNCPNEYSYRTLSGSDRIIRNVHLCALMGTQPEKLQDCLPDSAFGGGLASRILFIYQPSTERKNPRPKLTDEQILLKQDLINHLQMISRIEGQFKLTEAGGIYYDKWYNTIQPPNDKRLDGFYGRKHDHALRVAIILSAAQQYDLTVDEDMLQAAVMSLDVLEGFMPGAFSSVGAREIKADTDRTIRILQKHQRISHSDLLKKNYGYLNADQFRVVMETLIESGWVQRDADKASIYVWTGPEEIK